ncbi:hypothetical protein [uncultured Hyphomonas sp.]|uniref:hypothetical protein n=1 Tax=uncultured Hyphomonas sp. TaxID=225298 RepID=UPI002AAB17A1|nr:hypothetical protein [uncultured Hyphomonas sp.]
MEQVIRSVFRFGPLIFALGFLAPLIAQIIGQLNWSPPFGISPLAAGLLVGGAYGLVAQFRGRWI